MEIIDLSKSLIENIYFISGPIIALIGLLIILQIRIAKKQLAESQKQLKVNSQRIAATVAAQQVKIYCDNIIPLENKIYFEQEKINFPKFKGEIKNFTNDEYKSWTSDYKIAFLNKPDSLALLELDILNELESFSINLTQKIGDEKIAFSSIGNEFCYAIEDLYPLLSFMRGSKNPNPHYSNIITLYMLWKARLDNFKLEQEEHKISKEVIEKLKKLEELRYKKINSTNEIKPIGT